MRVALLVSRDLRWSLSLARTWAAGGDAVHLVLLDGAVAAARTGHVDAPLLREAVEDGITVSAEERALARRALGADRLLAGVKVASLDEVADLLVDGAEKAVWL